MPTGSKRISDLIKRDHRELEEYYQRIINSDSEDEQIRYQNQFIWELARHSIGEELVVYPKMEKFGGGKEMAAKDREQHQTVSNSELKRYFFDEFDQSHAAIEMLGAHLLIVSTRSKRSSTSSRNSNQATVFSSRYSKI